MGDTLKWLRKRAFGGNLAKKRSVNYSKDYAKFLAEFDAQLKVLTQKMGELPKNEKTKAIKKKTNKIPKKVKKK